MWTFPENFNPGAIPREKDPRDVPFSAFVPKAATVDWTHGYDLVRDLKYPLLIKDQGGSSSCVGQATAYLAEIHEFIETGKFTELSARDVYSHIYIPPDGGAYGFKGLSLLSTRGIPTELRVRSLDKGSPPSEAFMRARDEADATVKEALIRKTKGYAHVDVNNADELAYAIQHQKGVIFGVLGDNEGWQTGYPVPPKSRTPWGHFLELTGFKMVGNKKMFWGPNSWGEYWGAGGMYYLTEDYFTGGWAFNAMALLDLPNNWQNLADMKRVIKLRDLDDQYVVESGRKMKIPDADTLVFLRDEIKVITGTPEVVELAEFNSLITGKPLPSTLGDQFIRDAYAFFKDRLPLLKDIVEAE